MLKRPIIRRLFAFYIVAYILMAGLDTATTIYGLSLGYHEANPNIDTSSIFSMIFPSIVLFVGGLVSLGLGCMINTPLALQCVSFRSFRKAFWNNGILVGILVLLPVGAAATRVIPVLNNTTYILWGWGLTGTPAAFIAHFTGISDHAAHGIISALLLATAGITTSEYIAYRAFFPAHRGAEPRSIS